MLPNQYVNNIYVRQQHTIRPFKEHIYTKFDDMIIVIGKGQNIMCYLRLKHHNDFIMIHYQPEYITYNMFINKYERLAISDRDKLPTIRYETPELKIAITEMETIIL